MKILTYNTAMLPDPFGTDKEVRAGLIVDEILNGNFDFICLQEVFSEPIRKIFDTGFSELYPYRKIKSDDNDFLNEDSGLFFASKFPFSGDTKFQEFFESQLLTSDSISDKGIFGAKVLIDNGSGNGQKLYIFNTHLQSTEAYYEVRTKQLSQIHKFIITALKNRNSTDKTSCLLVGDFNVIGDVKDEYGVMMKELYTARDLFREFNSSPGFTWDGTINKFINKTARNDHDQQRLDFIFSFDEIPIIDDNSKINTELVPVIINDIQTKPFISPHYDNGCNLSDHFGLELSFNI